MSCYCINNNNDALLPLGVVLRLCLSLLLILPASASSTMQWQSRTGYPGPARHHPITFANETHGFLLTGSAATQQYTSDFYMYDEASGTWSDLSTTASAFPGAPRSFGYGVVFNRKDDERAFLGFGMGAADGNGDVPRLLADWWQFDMRTHEWEQLADFPGPGRRHPAMNAVYVDDDEGEIHVGLGDGLEGNYNDWWSYSVAMDTWTQLPNFPGSARHHPFYFALGSNSYAGLGHSNGYDPYIERDWYKFSQQGDGTWQRQDDFASYNGTELVTTEARVAGTQFSIEMPIVRSAVDGDTTDATTTTSTANASTRSIGFVLSGDGDDHRSMETGEFHAMIQQDGTGTWRQLPPHPGRSRWAPGSFVMRGTARAYFTSGYDRQSQTLYNDLWCVDLAPLFVVTNDDFNEQTTTDGESSSSATNGGPQVVDDIQSSTYIQDIQSSEAIRSHHTDTCLLLLLLASPLFL